MYFFIFPHHAIFKQFSLIHKTIVINAFFTKMVSKCVSISVCWQNGFNLRMCFLKYKYTETSTPHISKYEFSQPGGTGVDVTQKQKVVLIRNLAQIWRKTYSIELWRPFLNFDSKFELHSKITWLVDWQPSKNPASWFYAECPYVSTLKIWANEHLRLLS